MKTRSSPRGETISRPEVTHTSEHGFWLLVTGQEYFLPFDKFPWFRGASRQHLADVELLHGSHLHWPALDVDLSLDIIEQPDRYQLVYR